MKIACRFNLLDTNAEFMLTPACDELDISRGSLQIKDGNPCRQRCMYLSIEYRVAIPSWHPRLAARLGRWLKSPFGGPKIPKPYFFGITGQTCPLTYAIGLQVRCTHEYAGPRRQYPTASFAHNSNLQWGWCLAFRSSIARAQSFFRFETNHSRPSMHHP